MLLKKKNYIFLTLSVFFLNYNDICLSKSSKTKLSKDDFVVTTTITGIIASLFFGSIGAIYKNYKDFYKSLDEKMDKQLTDLGLSKKDVSSLKNSIANEFGSDKYDLAIKYSENMFSPAKSLESRIDAFSDFINLLPIVGNKEGTSKADAFLKVINSEKFKTENKDNELFTERDLLFVMKKSNFTTKDIENITDLMSQKNIKGIEKYKEMGLTEEDFNNIKYISNRLTTVESFEIAYQNKDVKSILDIIKSLDPQGYNDFLINSKRQADIINDSSKNINERDDAFIEFIDLLNKEVLKNNLISNEESNATKDLFFEYYEKTPYYRDFFSKHTDEQKSELKQKLKEKSPDEELAESLQQASTSAEKLQRIEQLEKTLENLPEIEELPEGQKFESGGKYFEKEEGTIEEIEKPEENVPEFEI